MAPPTRAAVEPLSPAHDHPAVVLVSSKLYVACWWGVLSMHLFTAVVVLFGSFVHLVLSIDIIHRATSAIGIPVPLKRVAGCGYLIVAFLHFRAVHRLVSQSLRSKQLTLQPIYPSQSSRRSAATSVASVTRMEMKQPASRSRPLLRYLSMAQNVLGPDGYFGINGPYFTPSLLLRETVEIAMQTYQLWTLSYNVSRVWINTFAVVTVVLNCFSMPVVHTFFKKRLGQKRLMHLVVDMYLDFTCAVVVPLCILLPYQFQFNWSTMQYPFELVVDDVWFANAIAEARQVMVTSYVDLFSSLLPQYSIYSCLRLLKSIVKREPMEGGARKRRAIVPQPDDSQAGIIASLKTIHTASETENRGIRFVSSLIALWGVAALGFHIHANRFSWRPEYRGCLLYVRPWLAENISCSVMQVNCYRWNTTGSSHDMARILNPLGRSTLVKLVFTHCAALTIPSTLTEFSRVKVILSFNNTLVDWPAEAAIRQATHPVMADIYFTRTVMRVIPPGLLHRSLPQSLLFVGFYNSTLSQLPTDLGDVWAETRIVRIGLQFTPVRAIPTSLSRMKSLQKLWMVSIPIVSFPDDVFADSAFVSIRLSGMPLQNLPNTVGDTSKLGELLVEHTDVYDLPAWTIAWLDAHSGSEDREIRSFVGSPICSGMNSTWRSKIAAWRICERDHGSQFGEFPVGAFDNHYPV